LIATGGIDTSIRVDLSGSLSFAIFLVLKDVSKMRLLFLGLILMCVSLGMVLTIALESWLRGNSYLWWLLVVLLLLLGVTALGITVFVGTHKLTDGRKLNGPDAGA
jgi:hypothetical protein